MKYEDAKKEKVMLEKYIYLVDNYNVNNINQWIIKQYALTNSISNVIKNARLEGNEKISHEITREKILEILNSKPIDELHSIIIKGYKRKIRRKY